MIARTNEWRKWLEKNTALHTFMMHEVLIAHEICTKAHNE